MTISGDLNLALRTAQSGLTTHQRALNTVANNIANVNTDGYTRKIVQLEQRVVAGAGGGVELKTLGRHVDESLLMATRQELSVLHAGEAMASFASRVQDLFGTPESNASLAHVLSRFQSAISTLGAAPDGAIEQRDLVAAATEAASSLNRLSDAVQDLRLEADQRLARGADEVNTLLQRIAAFNDRIVRDAYVGQTNNDLRDERDRALDRLAQLMDIRAVTRPRADTLVFTTDGRTLVDDQPATVSHAAAASIHAQATYAEGDFAGLYIGAADPANDITAALPGGELAGLIELRDRILPDLQSTLDELAAQLRDTVNAIHNSGVPFPGLSRMQGSRSFIDPASQTITLASGDVAIGLFDAAGEQQAATTLGTIMTDAGYPAGGPWTLATMAAELETWLQGQGLAGASVGFSGGGLDIDLGSHAVKLALRDQSGSAFSDPPADVRIDFDADADGAADVTATGFAAFFGLNDFFVDDRSAAVQDSQVMEPSFTVPGASTLRFANAAGWSGTADIAAGATLADVAAAITLQTGLIAHVVPDGAGQRLRIHAADGEALAITAAAGDPLLPALALQPTNSGVAAAIAVRADIAASPSLTASGTMHYDAGRGARGAYFLSRGDGTAMIALADAVAQGVTFRDAGTLDGSVTSFAGYAATLISDVALRADALDRQQSFQSGLVDSLEYKAKSGSGVNLDQEVSDLMMFEQAYSASARVIGIVQKMFEALQQAIG